MPLEIDELDPGRRFDPDDDARRRAAARARLGKALLVLAAGGVLAVGGWLFARRPIDVHVVNGTSGPYAVDLNGQTVRLAAYGRQTISLAPGEITVAVRDTALPVPPRTIRLSGPPLSRLLARRDAVINPDAMAVLIREEIEYSERPRPDGEASTEVMCGQVLYELDAIDYRFEEFPEVISSTRRGAETRRRIDQIPGLGAAALAGLVEAEQGEDALAEHLRRAAAFEPERGELFDMLVERLDDPDARAILEPGLARRPLLLEWHRAWQILARKHRPDDDLEPEYLALLEEDRDDPVRQYLYARLLDDAAEQERLGLASVRGGVRSSRPAHMVFVALFATARFGEAMELSEAMLAHDADDGHFLWHQIETLTALGRLEDAAEVARRRYELDRRDTDAAVDLLTLLRRLDRDEACRELIDAHADRLATADGDDPETVALTRAHLEAADAYAGGDGGAYAAFTLADHGSTLGFRGAIARGDLDEALRIVESADEDSGQRLWLAIAAMHGARTDVAETCLSQMADDWAQTGWREPDDVPAWLRGEPVPDPERLLALGMPGRSKLGLMTVLGLRHAAMRARCFDLARRLDVHATFPHLLLRDVLDNREPVTPAPASAVQDSRLEARD